MVKTFTYIQYLKKPLLFHALFLRKLVEYVINKTEGSKIIKRKI